MIMSDYYSVLKFLDDHHAFIIEVGADIATGVAAGLGQEELVLPIQAAKLTAELNYDKMHKMAEEAFSTVAEIEDVYGKGSKELAAVKEKVRAINSTVDKHLSNMSNKQQKVSDMPRSGSVPVLTTYAGKRATSGTKAAQRGAAESFAIRSPKTPVISSALTNNLSYFDSHLVEGPSEKNLTALTIKIGKQVYPDVITPFLKNLNGSGKIRMQFAGRCMSKKNERHTHMQIFRHRLSDATNFTGGAWPTGSVGTADYILGPQNTVPFKIDGGGPSTVSNAFAIGTTSFRDILNKSTYWAPYNKADLEDLSWNLNGLKLDNGLWAPPVPSVEAVAVPGSAAVTIPVDYLLPGHFELNAKLFQPDDHARQSHIAKNNKEAVVLPPSSTTRPGCYRYNAVFNKGSIEYDFLNKGTGGAKVELIVYRMKKDQTLTTNGTSHGNNPSLLNEKIANAIGAGYLETCVEKGATDKLLGRPPVATDVSENPSFPFLPTLKKTLGSDMWFVEVSRQTFAMPSGSRRMLTVQLPGEVYDPANIKAEVASTSSATTYPPILDNGSYCIMMSVSGVKCTNEITSSIPGTPGVPKFSYNIGDMFATANIQFYGTYTEHMGACQYKSDKVANIYTQGALLDPSPPLNFNYRPIIMLPADSAVRVGQVPGGSPLGGQSNLAPDMAAEPI